MATPFPSHNQAFDPETTHAMGEAYDACLQVLHDRRQPAVVKEALAEHIIAAATKGERDPALLCDAALQATDVSRRRPPE
jgi:hypothetical protein